MPGTDLVYGTTHCSAMPGTDLVYGTMHCSAMSSTELAYGAMHCYAMSGTELAYGSHDPLAYDPPLPPLPHPETAGTSLLPTRVKKPKSEL
eukprot:1889384-Rhodomonas_salina.1